MPDAPALDTPPLLDTPVGFIAVTNFETAKAFYVGVLGLEFVTHDGFSLVLKSGALSIRLTAMKDYVAPPFSVFGWQVTDIEATVAALAARGVVFEIYGFFGESQAANGVWTAPNGDKVAWFKDPSGNVLGISQHVQ